ncbi:hypothetical protein Syun_029298 [Stephania yunnanensis]|uniref:Uncharacterized protein n=1 Tax=Stephania yunnanensis TaxID=152371 RepID=A0AAP0EDC5_9MAGN
MAETEGKLLGTRGSRPDMLAAVDLTSEIVFDNDEFETNANDEEDDEFTSSLDGGSEDEFELHPSSVAAKKMSLVFKSGYLKEGWKWEYVFFTWDLPMSFAIYDAWCRRAAIRYTGNIYLIAKKRITPIYLTEEVFKHYKRMRATDEAFEKSEQMSSNRKYEVGGSGTGISLHSAGSISARQHGDTLMSTQIPDTSIDEDVIYLEVVPEVKGRVYGLGSQGYHHSISSGGASSSRGPAYGLHELEELQ